MRPGICSTPCAWRSRGGTGGRRWRPFMVLEAQKSQERIEGRERLDYAHERAGTGHPLSGTAGRGRAGRGDRALRLWAYGLQPHPHR